MKNKRIYIIAAIFILYSTGKHGTLSSQLPSDYIKNYFENSSINRSINIYTSSDGETYSYKIDQTDSCIIQSKSNKIKIILANNIIHLTNENIFYTYQKNIYKESIEVNRKTKVTNGEIIVSTSTNNSLLIYTNLKELYIIDSTYELNIRVNKYKSYYTNENGILNLFNTNNKTILSSEKGHIFIQDSIISIIPGIKESLLISNNNIYKYNNKKNKIIQTIKKKLDITNLYNLEKSFFYENNIYTNICKDSIIIDNYFISDTTLNTFPFYKISNRYGSVKQTFCDVNIINIENNNLKKIYHNSLYNKMLYKINDGIYSIITEINSFQDTPKIIHYVHNFHYDKIVNLDSLNIHYSNLSITPDGKHILISTKYNELYKYSYETDKLLLLKKEFPYIITDFEYLSEENNIQISSYDIDNEIIKINSGTIPYIIKKNGIVDSLNFKNIKSKYTINKLHKIDDTIDAIYCFNLENGFSQLFYLENKSIKEISNNENYKYYQSQIYDNETFRDGFIKRNENYIYWSETNLTNGIKYFRYNRKSDKTEELDIISRRVHDSLKYKYISLEIDNELITGCFKFPKDYDSLRKYPVIIQIYLNKTIYLHYTSSNSSTLQNIENKSTSAILNEINLLHQDYIICYIDIPIVNHIYSSHSKNINIYIKNVFPKIQSIDINNIAITGHSRSVGQVLGALVDTSCMIKCAIISNGITSELMDITTFSNAGIDYRNPEKETLKNRYSRFSRRYTSKNNLYNMYGELENNFEKTILIDPFFNLKNLNASILFMFNDNDASVNSSNGYYTYIKSKLLKKNTYLINFIKEGHLLSTEENSKIFYKYAINYLNFYLKKGNNSNKYWENKIQDLISYN